MEQRMKSVKSYFKVIISFFVFFGLMTHYSTECSFISKFKPVFSTYVQAFKKTTILPKIKRILPKSSRVFTGLSGMLTGLTAYQACKKYLKKSCVALQHDSDDNDTSDTFDNQKTLPNSGDNAIHHRDLAVVWQNTLLMSKFFSTSDGIFREINFDDYNNHDVPISVHLESLLASKCAPILVNRRAFVGFYKNYKPDLSTCDIYYKKGCFLLIPHEYKNKHHKASFLEKYGIESKKQRIKTYKKLGFDSSDWQSIKEEHILDHQCKAENSIEYEQFVDPELSHEKIKTTFSSLLNQHDGKKFSWNLSFFGHGGSGYAVGMENEAFRAIIHDLAKRVSVHALLYNTCYGGSRQTRGALNFNNEVISFPVISVGFQNMPTFSDTNRLFDYTATFNALHGICRDRCCWKEKLVKNLNTLFTYKNRNKLPLRDTSKDNSKEDYKILNTDYDINNLVSLKPDYKFEWLMPNAPRFYTKSSSCKSYLKTPLLFIDQVNVEDKPLVLVNEDQRILSGLEGNVAHHIQRLGIPKLRNLAVHFSAHSEEEKKFSKVFIIDSIGGRDDDGTYKDYENVKIELPHGDEQGKITLNYNSYFKRRTIPFESFNIDEAEKYKLL